MQRTCPSQCLPPNSRLVRAYQEPTSWTSFGKSASKDRWRECAASANPRDSGRGAVRLGTLDKGRMSRERGTRLWWPPHSSSSHTLSRFLQSPAPVASTSPSAMADSTKIKRKRKSGTQLHLSAVRFGSEWHALSRGPRLLHDMLHIGRVETAQLASHPLRAVILGDNPRIGHFGSLQAHYWPLTLLASDMNLSTHEAHAMVMRPHGLCFTPSLHKSVY